MKADAVLLQFVADPEMDSVWSDADGEATISFSIYDLVDPDDFMSNYYHYWGSLTTPPCTPAVSWHLAQNTVKVRSSTMEAFRAKTALWTYSGGIVDATTNFRPLQDNPSCITVCGGDADDEGYCPGDTQYPSSTPTLLPTPFPTLSPSVEPTSVTTLHPTEITSARPTEDDSSRSPSSAPTLSMSCPPRHADAFCSTTCSLDEGERTEWSVDFVSLTYDSVSDVTSFLYRASTADTAPAADWCRTTNQNVQTMTIIFLYISTCCDDDPAALRNITQTSLEHQGEDDEIALWGINGDHWS